MSASVVDLMVCPVEVLPSMLAERVAVVANEAVAARGRFVVAFAGGSLVCCQCCPTTVADVVVCSAQATLSRADCPER